MLSQIVSQCFLVAQKMSTPWLLRIVSKTKGKMLSSSATLPVTLLLIDWSDWTERITRPSLSYKESPIFTWTTEKGWMGRLKIGLRR